MSGCLHVLNNPLPQDGSAVEENTMRAHQTIGRHGNLMNCRGMGVAYGRGRGRGGGSARRGGGRRGAAARVRASARLVSTFVNAR